MIPRTREEKVLHRGSVERVLHYRSKEDCANPSLGFKNLAIPRKWEEKFLQRGSVERVRRCGSREDCADLLFSIKQQNDS